MKLDRLLAITMMLINRKKISAKELADHFEVSVRTILRDLETINQAGIPVVSYQGANGGFGIIEEYKIDRNVLTPDEVISIVIALKGVSTTLEDRKIKDTLEKMKTLIPGHQNEMNRRGNQLIIDFSPWGSSKAQKDRLNIVRRAIEDSKLLSFYYTNTQGISSQREVEPTSLSFKGYSWYLHGYCREKKGFRIFRLSRIKKLTIEDQGFTPREEIPNETGWVADTSNNRNSVDLVLRFTPRVRYRVEDFFDEEQVTLQQDGTMIVKVSWPEDDWVYGTILSYGEDVEVLEPPHIREIIKEKAKGIQQMYC